MPSDAVRTIMDFNTGRDPERLAMKYTKMRSSVFAFLRGSCHLFYQRMPQNGITKNVPLVWACGDLHLENFGSYKGDNRLVYFDVNDFDEGALAPASWDLIHMLTSIWVGAEGIAPTVGAVRSLCECFLTAYSHALANGKPYWVERDTATGPVRKLLGSLRERSRADFLNSRTDSNGKKRALRIDGKKALAASKAQRAQVTDLMAAFAKTQPNPEFYKVLDVARRIAGTGSLGLDRYAILVKGKGSPDCNYLLDLKLSVPSALAPELKKIKQPRWQTEAHRVVALQQRGQAVPMAFLQPILMGDKSYILRGLQPSEDRVAVAPNELTVAGLHELLISMGKVVAWMHLRAAGRQGAAGPDDLIAWGKKSKWQRKLIDASLHCAELVRDDAQAFNAAYDAGSLNAH